MRATRRLLSSSGSRSSDPSGPPGAWTCRGGSSGLRLPFVVDVSTLAAAGCRAHRASRRLHVWLPAPRGASGGRRAGAKKPATRRACRRENLAHMGVWPVSRTHRGAVGGPRRTTRSGRRARARGYRCANAVPADVEDVELGARRGGCGGGHRDRRARGGGRNSARRATRVRGRRPARPPGRHVEEMQSEDRWLGRRAAVRRAVGRGSPTDLRPVCERVVVDVEGAVARGDEGAPVAGAHVLDEDEEVVTVAVPEQRDVDVVGAAVCQFGHFGASFGVVKRLPRGAYGFHGGSRRPQVRLALPLQEGEHGEYATVQLAVG